MSISPPALPASYSWGFVVGQVIHAIADTTADVDRLPQARAATGTIRFEPLETLRKVTAEPAAFVAHEVVTATLGATGEMVDAEGQVGIWLVTGDYRVSFALSGAAIPSFNIAVTAAHTLVAPLDLVTVSPYTPPTGSAVTTLLVPAGPAEGQVLGWASGALTWVAAGAGGGGSAPDATTTTRGIVRLAGDLGGTADAPTVPGLAGKAAASHTHDDRYYTETETDALLGGKAAAIHGHTVADVTGLQGALDGKQAAGSYAAATHSHDGTYAPALGPDDNYVTDAEKAALHSHANKTALDAVSGVNTGDQDLSGYATTTALSTGLAGKAAATHSHAGIYAPALGTDDNYVTDAEKVKLGNLSGINTGDQTLPTWSTIAGKPAVVAAGADAAAARAAIGAGTSDLTLGTTASTAKAGNYSPPAASATAQGIVELATVAETTTGTDTARAVTPAGVKAVADTKAAASHTHGVTDLTATGTRDATTYLRGDNTWATPAGGGGGVTDHGALTGLGDDDHSLYALADGTRGAFAAPLGPDDNYVSDAEKAALHSHPAVIAQGATAAAARTAIGAGTSSFSGAYGDLSGKPTLGTAAATASTDYATAAQGAKADSALQPATGQAINAQTGTAYTLVAADAGKLVTLTNASAGTLTVPGNVFTAGQRVDCIVAGAGMVTVVGSSCTVNGTPSLVSRAQYSAFTVLFTSATTAVVVGDLASA